MNIEDKFSIQIYPGRHRTYMASSATIFQEIARMKTIMERQEELIEKLKKGGLPLIRAELEKEKQNRLKAENELIKEQNRSRQLENNILIKRNQLEREQNNTKKELSDKQTQITTL